MVKAHELIITHVCSKCLKKRNIKVPYLISDWPLARPRNQLIYIGYHTTEEVIAACQNKIIPSMSPQISLDIKKYPIGIWRFLRYRNVGKLSAERMLKWLGFKIPKGFERSEADNMAYRR